MLVAPGKNVWLLARTDRDGVSASEVADTAGPAMGIFLRDAQPTTDPVAVVERAIETGEDQWRIGAARPVQVRAVQRNSEGRPKLPAGAVLETRSGFEGDVLPTVAGSNPWWVLVEFWWRGAQAQIPYPVLKVGTFGGRSRDAVSADWFLERAIKPTVEGDDPGDESFGDAITDRATTAIGNVARPLAIGAGVIGAVALAGYVSFWLMQVRR